MKLLLLTLFLFLSSFLLGQMPVVEEFNAGTTWTYTNGAGMQNYGGAENYATFNMGTTPYPNSSTVTITSPIANHSALCGGTTLNVSFPIEGRIENGFDFVYFEYYNAGAWVLTATYTGNQNSIKSYVVPKTATQFRFRLVTDATVNTYNPPGPITSTVYYYDITSFTISCTVSLPITLIFFDGSPEDRCNLLEWKTASEQNNDFFTLEKTLDGTNYEIVTIVNGAGTSNMLLSYSFEELQPWDMTYYRLKQTDYDGEFVYSDLISVYRPSKNKQILRIINILGQEVDDNYIGVKIYYFSDGSFIRKI